MLIYIFFEVFYSEVTFGALISDIPITSGHTDIESL